MTKLTVMTILLGSFLISNTSFAARIESDKEIAKGGIEELGKDVEKKEGQLFMKDEEELRTIQRKVINELLESDNFSKEEGESFVELTKKVLGLNCKILELKLNKSKNNKGEIKRDIEENKDFIKFLNEFKKFNASKNDYAPSEDFDEKTLTSNLQSTREELNKNPVEKKLREKIMAEYEEYKNKDVDQRKRSGK